jgi:hypothetical protein
VSEGTVLDATETSGAILGFNGAQILLAEDFGGVHARDVATGTEVEYVPPFNYEESSLDGLLGPAGEVVTEFAPEESDNYEPVLFPKAMDPSLAVMLAAARAEIVSSVFCGDRLIQVVLDGSIKVVHRALDGSTVGTRKFDLTDYPDFRCNGTTGILHLVRVKNGRYQVRRSFSFDLP